MLTDMHQQRDNRLAGNDSNQSHELDAYDTHDSYQSSRSYMKLPPPAIRIKLHENKNHKTAGKLMTVKREKLGTFENFLQECTSHMKPNWGVVRNLHSAVSGRRVGDLREIQANKSYVITGYQPFEAIDYTEIADQSRQSQSKDRKKRNEQTFTPVKHAKRKELRDISAKYKKYISGTGPLLLRVHKSGQQQNPPAIVKISPNDRFDLESIRIAIGKHTDFQPTGMKIWKTEGGIVTKYVRDPEDLKSNDSVVISAKTSSVKPIERYSSKGIRNLQVRTALPNPLYYHDIGFGDIEATPSKKNLNRYTALPQIGSSNKSVSPYSNPPTQRTKRSDKPAKQTDYDQDDSGVYRAKNQNNQRGAKQVNETKETRTERPIDQMEAETVDEERLNEDADHQYREHNGGYDDDMYVRDERSSSPRANKTNEPRSSTPTNALDDSFNQQQQQQQEQQQQMQQQQMQQQQMQQLKEQQLKKQKEHEAAAKIQAGARGHIARKEYKKKKAQMQQEEEMKRQKEQQQQEPPKNNGKSKEEMDAAAEKIQASFKGFKTRKDLKAKQQGQK